jgi:mono/diheme cytochrome c family protein
MKFFAGLIVGLLLAVGIPMVAIYTGSINMGASQEPNRLEKVIGTMAWENCMRTHASDAKNPYGNDAKALQAGLGHYQENCVVCHAAPGLESSEIAKGMNPAPPMLDDVEDMNDGHLFWLIKNGIRMTGMPAFGSTHSDDEIWEMVGFVRHLTKLTPQEREMLQSSVEEEEHHHEDEDSAAEPKTEEPEHEHHHD